MKVRLSRKAGGEAMRTDSVEGTLERDRFPTLGEQVVMLAEALESSTGFRLVNTSPITLIVTEGKSATITTESGSVYELEEIE